MYFTIVTFSPFGKSVASSFFKGHSYVIGHPYICEQVARKNSRTTSNITVFYKYTYDTVSI